MFIGVSSSDLDDNMIIYNKNDIKHLIAFDMNIINR